MPTSPKFWPMITKPRQSNFGPTLDDIWPGWSNSAAGELKLFHKCFVECGSSMFEWFRRVCPAGASTAVSVSLQVEGATGSVLVLPFFLDWQGRPSEQQVRPLTLGQRRPFRALLDVEAAGVRTAPGVSGLNVDLPCERRERAGHLAVGADWVHARGQLWGGSRASSRG